jgi:hypothetical protein
MGSRGKFTQAGGFILAATIIAGTVGGVIAGQSSIGFLVGAGAGVLLALLVWLVDRR